MTLDLLADGHFEGLQKRTARWKCTSQPTNLCIRLLSSATRGCPNRSRHARHAPVLAVAALFECEVVKLCLSSPAMPWPWVWKVGTGLHFLPGPYIVNPDLVAVCRVLVTLLCCAGDVGEGK